MEQNTDVEREQVMSFLEFITRIERLSELPRTGWIFGGVQNPESIAAHQYGVAVVALWLSERIERRVDVESVLRMAILHDVSEAFLSDLPKPVKEMIGQDSVRGAEKKAEQRLLADVAPKWQETIERYRDRTTLEARIVEAADKIQMLVKALQYRNQNRGNVERFWENMDFRDFEDIPLVDAIFIKLEELFEGNGDIEGSF